VCVCCHEVFLPGGSAAGDDAPRSSRAIRSGRFRHRHVKFCGQLSPDPTHGADQPQIARLAASASSAALSFLKTASMVSKSSHGRDSRERAAGIYASDPLQTSCRVRPPVPLIESLVFATLPGFTVREFPGAEISAKVSGRVLEFCSL
jgi:hypothetical protein